ncbi:MAG: hypothetical protein ACU0B1_02360 [Thermohalobaculum sp.]
MRFLVALCLLIVFSGPARALDGLVECPDGNEALARVTATTYRVSLSDTYAMEIAGQPFEVPIGYLRPWPPRQFYRNQPFRSRKGFQFSFWMPDGRMPEVDTWFTVMNRPCEAGREQANEERFIVDVTYKPIGPNTDFDKSDFNGEFALSNLQKILDNIDLIQIGDMIEVRPKNFQVYWIINSPDASFDAAVACVKVGKAPNQLCTGDVWFHGDDFALYLVMPRDSIDVFSDAAKLARRLIGEWRQGAVAE